jgi:hypothetical protein
MIELEKSICKIVVERECGGLSKGTGFFISKDIILTSNHVITNNSVKIEIFKCNNQNEVELTATIIDKCEDCDYILLKLNEKFNSNHFLELCKSEIIEEEPIRIFGYPDDEQGQKIGERLVGSISRFIEDSTDTIQDIILDIKDFAHDTKYSAFSGSPVINEYGQVTSILKYQGIRSLSSVSIKKAKTFLEKNKIEVKPDQLHSFKSYNTNAFSGFEERKIECEIESKTPLEDLSPQTILDSNLGELFYPNKSQNINELIQILRKNTDLNSKLWTGWIQLLTYVEILKGNYKEPNSISIDIISSELFKKFGLIPSSRAVNMKLHLNFYFTEEDSYFQIAKKSIHDIQKKGINKDTCNIFNSNIYEFGNINNVKVDISNPDGSGPSINNIKIGSISLSRLNREVKSSNSLLDASNNLKKIFEDAIK